MRLTLRTMLACLDADDRLDPADVEDLSQKIQQSKYATDLASRIRRLVQHQRVGTPRLDAKGNGLDANSVAEYLDNTLAHERIADFERNCIESDVRLAEVGACHQILVLVLEQPAEIEPSVRERMYRLGAESSRQVPEETSHARTLPSGEAVRIDRPASAAQIAPVTKPLPEVPEYLRAGRRPSLWPLALAALLAFVAVGIGLRWMGPLDKTHPMAKLLGAGDEPPARRTNDTNDPTPAVVPPPVEPASVDNPAKKSIEPVNETDLPPVEPAVPLDPPMPNETEVPPAEPMKTEVPPAETTEPVEPMPPKEPMDVAKPIPLPPMPRDPAEPPQPAAADVGRFVSEDQVLVRIAADHSTTRVGARSSIFAGDELVVLPAYRAQVLLSNNVQFTALGETHFTPVLSGSDDVATITVDYGRALAMSVGKVGSRLALNLGPIQGIVSFADADSELALEVRYYLPPGENPQTPGATVPVVRLYTTRGKIAWQEGTPENAGEKFVIEAGQVRNYVGQDPGETVALAALPDWIGGKNIADIDRRAAREVEAKLTPDRPLELTLQEMASGTERQAEVRSLAVRSLICLSQFEPFLAAIADDTQRSYWAVEFDSCRDAITRNTELATYIHDTFVKQRGEQDGENLYRMMWGFSAEDLSGGLAEELVKSLDVELLDYRVLAFENLRRITGLTQLYQPQFPAARRRTPIAQWRERLKAGEIVYKTPPAPIMDPKPTVSAPRNVEAPLEP